jgi:hypothetical protein
MKSRLLIATAIAAVLTGTGFAAAQQKRAAPRWRDIGSRQRRLGSVAAVPEGEAPFLER